MQNSVAKSQFSRLAITALALMAFSGMASSVLAQSLPGRKFTPTLIGTGTIIDPYTAGTPVVNGAAYPVSAKTQGLVNPYLYVSGNLDVLFTVDGWGAGSSSYDTSFSVWHNMKVTLSISGFDDLLATDASGSTLPLTLSSSVTIAGVSSSWFTPTPAHGISVSSLAETTAQTAGTFTVKLTRQLTVAATSGPLPGSNTYSNQGFVNVTPSW